MEASSFFEKRDIDRYGARGRVTGQIHPRAESEETRSFWKSLAESEDAVGD